MIIFLTLIYVGFLALLIKFKVIKLTLWWKLSPLAWMLMLLVVLFLPMQWGAPSGPLTIYRGVVEIVPNVSGEVVQVSAQGSKPIAKGDVLFQIDPVPYRAEVDRLQPPLSQRSSQPNSLSRTSMRPRPRNHKRKHRWWPPNRMQNH